METALSFAWIGVLLLIGMALRAKLPFLKSTLAPACLIAGLLGFIIINTLGLPGTEFGNYTDIVAQLFIISFISIGLTKAEGGGGRQLAKGSMGMGFVWNILYGVTPVLGALVLMLIGGWFGMDPVYGLLVPFGFAQGPGQAAAFGATFESYGWEGAADVGVSFASLGFVMAFVVGAPLAKAGFKRGLGIAKRGMPASLESGYLPREEQKVSTGTQTVHIANIDPLAFHAALTGLTYALAYGVTWVLSQFIKGDTLWNMMFITGMLCAYLVKYIMKLLKLEFLHDNGTQRRITGFATDFLVAASFISVQMSVIGKWLAPILIVSALTGAVTFAVCLYFGRRFGGSNDFQRTLGLWGTATGTVPSGVALVRIVDPELETTTAAELGMMNVPMMLSAATMIVAPMVAAGTMDIWLGLGIMLVQAPIFAVLLKVLRCWNRPTYSFKEQNEGNKSGEETSA